MIVSGNLENEYHACKDMVTIGSKSNSHFQSLLLIDVDEDEMSPNNKMCKSNEEHGSQGSILYQKNIQPYEKPSPTNKKTSKGNDRPEKIGKSHKGQRSQPVCSQSDNNGDSCRNHQEMKPFM